MRNDSLLKEYARNLSEEALVYLISRFQYRCGGDLADIAHTLGRNREVDRWLASAENCTKWFEMIDSVEDALRKEDERREAAYQKELAERDKQQPETASLENDSA